MTNQELHLKLAERFFENQEKGSYSDICKKIKTNREELENFRKEAKKAGYIDFTAENGKYRYTIIID